jgi:tRNA(Ile2) C34 agmatinyltransferase TiaS
LPEELFFRCPKCRSIYSSSREIIETDRRVKAALTSMILGGRLIPPARPLKCPKCKVRVESISSEEYKHILDAGGLKSDQ